MPLTAAQGLRLSNDQLMAGLWEGQRIRTQLEAILKVYKINGDRLRIANIQDEQPLADPLAEGGAVPEQTQIPVNIEFPLGLIATDVSVNDKTQYTLSNVNDQAVEQVRNAVIRDWNKAWQSLITGTLATPGDFLGWRDPTFTTARQTVDATAGLTLSMLDEVQGKIRARNGWGNFMYMPRKIYDRVRALCYASGFMPQHEMFPVPNGIGGFHLQSIMHWNGWPMLYCDDAVFPDIVVGPARFSEIYVGVAGWDGVGWISPQSIGEKYVEVKKVMLQATGRDLYRIELPIATFRRSEDAIGRITNIALV